MTLPMRVQRGRSALELAHQELNDFFGRFLGGNLMPLRENGGESDALGLGAPFAVDIREDEDNVFIEADMPGFRKEDVEITLESGTLTIAAERRQEIEEPAPQGEPERGGRSKAKREGQDQTYLLRERHYQRFVRSFTLPPSVEEQDVQARLENGVLKITLHKRPESKTKKIPVG